MQRLKKNLFLNLGESCHQEIVRRALTFWTRLRGKNPNNPADRTETLRVLVENFWLLSIDSETRRDWTGLNNSKVISGLRKCINRRDFDTIQLALNRARENDENLLSRAELNLILYYRIPMMNGIPALADLPDQVIAELFGTSLDSLRKTRQRLKLKKPNGVKSASHAVL